MIVEVGTGGTGELPGTPGELHGRATRRIENEHCWAEFLVSGGPRIVGLGLVGGPNLFCETPDASWDGGYGKFELVGGHRLWIAPESGACSYPDSTGLTASAVPGGIRLTGGFQPPVGIRKAIEVRMSPDAASLTLRHSVANEGKTPLELAPWAITQFRLGGVAIVPLPVPIRTHVVTPNRTIALWPYTSLSDERISIGDKVLTVSARAGYKTKVGCLSHSGVAAYLLDGVLFTKRFDPMVGSVHTDFGTNVQLYCDENNIELESLGALVTLEPGETAFHDELWELRQVEGNVDVEALADLLR